MRRRRWTPEESDALRFYGGLLSDADMANQLGRSEKAIKWRRQGLAITKAAHWIDLERSMLRDLQPLMTMRQIGELLGRSRRSVQFSLECAGLTAPRDDGWTAEEDATLRRLFPDRSLAQVAQVLERPPRGVEVRAHRLGLKKSPAYLVSIKHEHLLLPKEFRQTLILSQKLKRELKNARRQRVE